MKSARKKVVFLLCFGFITVFVLSTDYYVEVNRVVLSKASIVSTNVTKWIPLKPVIAKDKTSNQTIQQEMTPEKHCRQTSDGSKEHELFNKTHILVNAYMRSGSTFLSSIFNKQPNVFYVHEPLWQFTMMGYFTANNTLCDSVTPHCWTNNGRPSLANKMIPFIRTGEMQVDAMLRALRNFYTCNFDDPNFDRVVDYVDAMSASYNYRGWLKYFHCKKKREKENITTCLSVLKQDCQTFPIILTKVLRLSTDAMEPLLTDYPCLKIIQLIRDPRAIICSRLAHTGWYPLGKKYNTTIFDNAKSLCQKMSTDFHAGLVLSKKYPNRLMFVRYEDLVGSKALYIQRKLFNFTDIRHHAPPQLGRKVQEHWRIKMSQTDVEQVNSACIKVQQKLGYKSLINVVERINLSITSYTNSSDTYFLNY